MTEWIITSSALILIIAAFRYLLRGKISLRLQYALWAIVLIRLLVPFSPFVSPLSVMNLKDTLPDKITSGVAGFIFSPAVPYTEIAEFGDADEYKAAYAEDSGIPASTERIPDAARTERYARERILMSVKAVLIWIWLGGASLTAACFITSNAVFYARLRRTHRKYDTAGTKLPVYTAEGLPSPCLFGIFRPAIYLTEKAASDDIKRTHVLAHELTHYAHRDNLWSLLRGVCAVLHWYNPLVWWAAALSRRDAELACDEAAIKRLGEESRVPYGRTLIELVSVKSPAELLRCATTMTSGKRGIKERIILLAKKPKMLSVTLIAVLLLAAAATICTFSGRSARIADASPSEAVYYSEETGAVELPEELYLELSEIIDGSRRSSMKKDASGELLWSVAIKISETGDGDGSSYILECYRTAEYESGINKDNEEELYHNYEQYYTLVYESGSDGERLRTWKLPDDFGTSDEMTAWFGKLAAYLDTLNDAQAQPSTTGEPIETSPTQIERLPVDITQEIIDSFIPFRGIRIIPDETEPAEVTEDFAEVISASSGWYSVEKEEYRNRISLGFESGAGPGEIRLNSSDGDNITFTEGSNYVIWGHSDREADYYWCDEKLFARLLPWALDQLSFPAQPPELGEKIAAGMSDPDPVAAYAWSLISADAAGNTQASREIFGSESTVFIDAEITKLEICESFDGMIDEAAVELWELHYRTLPEDINKIMFAGGMSADEEGWLLNTGSMGRQYPVVINRDGKREVVGHVWGGEGFDFEYLVCELFDRLGIYYNCMVDPGEFIGWEKIYYDFYKSDLEGLGDYITGCALLNLKHDRVPELLVYTAGDGKDGECAVFTIEDGELRLFNTEFTVPAAGYECEIIRAKNARDPVYRCNPMDTALPEDTFEDAYFRYFIDDTNPRNPYGFYMANSVWSPWPEANECDWFSFGADEEGCLSSEPAFTHRTEAHYDEDTDEWITVWYIDGAKTDAYEYANALEEFGVWLESLRFVNFSYDIYFVCGEDYGERGLLELIDRNGMIYGMD